MLKISLLPMEKNGTSPCQLLVQTPGWSFALIVQEVLMVRCQYPDGVYAEESFGQLSLAGAQNLLKNLVEAVNGQGAKDG